MPLDVVAAEIQTRAGRDLCVHGPPGTHWVRWRRLLVATFAVMLVAMLVAALPLPVGITAEPGVPVVVSERLEGPSARPGAVLVLSVARDIVTPAAVVRSLLDPDVDILWRPPAASRGLLRGTDGPQRRAHSEGAAVAAALRCLGQSVTVHGQEVIVATSSRPVAAGVLSAGDRVVAADGRPVTSLEDLHAVAARHRAGEQLVLEARSPDGTVRLGRVAVQRFEGAIRPVGIDLAEAALRIDPRPAVALDLHGLDGASAGLAAALGVVDAVGPEPLVAGRTVAATGTISADGRVGPITGLRYKAAAARKAGATVMVVPAAQADFARAQAGPRIAVVGAHTLNDAVRALGGPGCTA